MLNEDIVQDIDKILNREESEVREVFYELVDKIVNRYQESRSLSIAITKLQEAAMWIALTDLKELKK